MVNIIVKKEYISPIVKVIKWFLETYAFDSMNEERLNRVLNRLGEAKENYICTGEELYLVKEAFSYAKSEHFQEGVKQQDVFDIYDWLEEEYWNGKKQ